MDYNSMIKYEIGARIFIVNGDFTYWDTTINKIVIAIEDLNVKGLAAGMLAKSVRDAGWSSFFSMLSYKAEYAGRELVKVDPRGTSQTCVCGTRVPKGLSDRWHKCPACGLSAVVLECRQIRTS